MAKLSAKKNNNDQSTYQANTVSKTYIVKGKNFALSEYIVNIEFYFNMSSYSKIKSQLVSQT